MVTLPRRSPWPSLAPYPHQPLSQFFAETARRLPAKPALIDADGRTYAFGQLWETAQGLAGFLHQQAGVRSGETVAIFAPNAPEWAVVLHGSLLAGTTLTTLNPLYREREVAHQLADAEAVVVFAARAALPTVMAVREELPRLRAVYPLEEVWALAASSTGWTPVDFDPEQQLAALPYSSGTTGLPKGVMLSHANLVANFCHWRATDLIPEDGVVLSFLPFFHIYGLAVLLSTPLGMGATNIILPRFDPEQVLHAIERYRVTALFVAPPALLALAHHPAVDRSDHTSLRFIMSAAAPLPLEVADAGERRFGVPVLQAYGLTETSPLANVNPLAAIKRGSGGPPVADTEERVVDPATGQDVPVGEPGELLIRGPQVMRGYWNNPDATAATLLPEGWLRSGDLVRMDEDGYVFVLDRLKELIKYKGYQVAPAELEAVLLEHPAVRDACVIPKPAPDPSDGEIPKAFVVRAEDQPVSAEELMAFVAERLAPYKKVRELQFVDAIPKNPSGKLLRRVLIEQEHAQAATG